MHHKYKLIKINNKFLFFPIFLSLKKYIKDESNVNFHQFQIDFV